MGTQLTERDAARVFAYPCESAEAEFEYLDGLAEITGAYGVKEGANALKLETEAGVVDDNSEAVSLGFPLVPGGIGLEYIVQAWVFTDRHGTSSFTLDVRTWNGNSWLIQESIGDTGPGWVLKQWTIVPAAPPLGTNGFGAFRFTTTPPPGFPPTPIATNRWLVDNIKVFGPVISTTLNTALKADLNAIDGTGDFATNIGGRVYDEPEQESKLDRPCITYTPGGGGEDDPDVHTPKTGEAVQRFSLRLLVRSETPHADALALLDDIRLAVGRTTSNLLAVPGVLAVGVSEWTDELVTSRDQGGRRAEWDCIVSVRYTYNRNAV